MYKQLNRALTLSIASALPTLAVAAGVTLQPTGITFPDGTIQTTAGGPGPAQIAWVATAGGHYNSPLDALTDLATWCGTPAVDNPCLIRIAPGIYDLGATALEMVPYVSIEGSGIDVTILTGTVSTLDSWNNSALVVGADNAELAKVSVQNVGDQSYAVGIFNYQAAPRIREVSIDASGASFNYGIFNERSSPELDRVKVIASGGSLACGVRNYNTASPTMSGITVKANGASSENWGVNSSQNSHPKIFHSRIIFGSLFNDANSTTKIVASQVIGVVGGGWACVGDYNASYVALNATCQVP